MKDLCTEYFGNNIKVIHNKIDTLFTKETNKLVSGLTNTQYITLIYLSESLQQRTLQKNIETKFELSHPTTVGIIKRLVAQNLVTTQPFQKNKRQTEVVLTEKGKKLLESINGGPRKILDDVDNSALAGFSNDEKELLNAFLQRINNNLNNLS